MVSEREVTGSIPVPDQYSRPLNNSVRIESNVFYVQTARPSRGSDNHVEMAGGPVSSWRRKKRAPISNFLLNTLTLK